jgi:thioredoxin 1
MEDDNKMKKTIIKFTASWCYPCKQMSEVLKNVVMPEDVIFKEIDVDTNPGLAESYDVRNIPMLIKIKNGEIIDSIQGMSNITKIKTWVNEW